MDTTHSRTEVADKLKRETGRNVYPGSITRHRSHFREYEDFYISKTVEQANAEASAQSMDDYVDERIADFKALLAELPTMSVEERLETFNALQAVKKAYHLSIANPKGEVSLAVYYSDRRYIQLSDLYMQFKPDLDPEVLKRYNEHKPIYQWDAARTIE